VNYYQRNIGDYARDAGHLSMLEDGAYTRLMDRYYHKERGIPEAETYRLCRARTDEERAAVDAVLREFFRLENGVWIKNKIEEELVKAKQAIEVARENGKRGGRPPKPKPNPEKTQPFSKQNPNRTQAKAPNHQPPTSTEQDQEHLPEPAAPVRAAVLIPLNDGTEYALSEEQAAEYARLYPAVDVPAELRAIRAWGLSNLPRRKTRSGVLKHVNGWLAKAQNEGPKARAGPAPTAQPGKNMSAILGIQRRQRERLAADGNRTGDSQAALPGPRRPTGSGAD
jgi:uncharacterized protein YdaU (DUF1376 family)